MGRTRDFDSRNPGSIPGPRTSGELWSFFRDLISQGTYIQMDYAAGKFKCYEEFSARLDAAARERVDQFLNESSETVTARQEK